MNGADAVHTDGQLGVVGEHVFAHGGTAEHRAIGRGTHPQTQFAGEEERQIAQWRKQEWLATHPTDQHAVAGGALIVGKHRSKTPDHINVGFAPGPGQPPVVSTERTAQITPLGDAPNDDHAPGSWSFSAGPTPSP